MPSLKFYNLQTKEPFTTDEFELIKKETAKGTRYFAVAINSSGKESWRIVGKDFYELNKE